MASSDRELTASQGTRVSREAVYSQETVFSSPELTPPASGALPGGLLIICRHRRAPELAPPQASPALPPTAPGHKGSAQRSTLSARDVWGTCAQHRSPAHAEATPGCGERGPLGAGWPHLSDSSSICSSNSTVRRLSLCPRTSPLGFQKTSALPRPSSSMNTSLSCPDGQAGLAGSEALAPWPPCACPRAASYPVTVDTCHGVLSRSDLPRDLVDARAAPKERLRGHTRDRGR